MEYRRAGAADAAKRLQNSTASDSDSTNVMARQTILRFAAPKTLRAALGKDRYSDHYWMTAANALMQKDEAIAKQVAENLTAALDIFHHHDECNTIIRILASLGSHAVEPILARLDGYEQQGRESALRALGEIGDTRALEPLTSFLFDTNEHLRVVAARSLQGLKVRPDTATLLKAAQDTVVRVEVAKLLEQVGNPESIQGLVQMLQDENSEVRFVAARALRGRNWTPENDAQKLQMLIAEDDWQAVVRFDEMAVEPLLSLHSDNANVMAALLQVAKPPLLEQLIKDYGSRNMPRQAILSAIETMKFSRTVPYILYILEDCQRWIDHTVSKSTEDYNSTGGELDFKARDEIEREEAILAKAAQALEAAAQKSSISALIRAGKACTDTGRDIDMRRAIIRALKKVVQAEGIELSKDDLHMILEISEIGLQQLVQEQLARRV